MLRIVNVELLVVKLPDGGERVIPSMNYLKRSLRAAQNQIEDTEAEIEDSEIEAEQTALAQNVKFLKRSARLYARLIKEQPASAEHARKVCYQIKAPTYLELIAFESASRVEDEDMPRFDTQKLMDAVVPTMFEGDAPEDPQHIKKCWERWREEAYPNEAELPFPN